jgi:septal ring factor EnvC (AmiA/AmiB activator)
MGFGGSSKNLAQQLNESQARVSELEGQYNAAQAQVQESGAKIVELEAQVAQAKQDLEAAGASAEAAAVALAAAEGRAATAEATVGDLEKKLANPGEAYGHATAGKPTPVPEGGVDASDAPRTWAEALKAEGGDYVAARKKHPEAFASQFKK